MRYDKIISLYRDERGSYNEDTGDYEHASDGFLDSIIASVNDASDQTVKLIYGEIREGVLVIHVPYNIGDGIDYIKYKDKKYRIDRKRNLRFKTTFIVSEVH